MADHTVAIADLPGWYKDATVNIPQGLSQLIVHPGIHNDELASITHQHTSFGAAWRQQDFDVLFSHEFEDLLQAEDINVVNWSTLRNSVGAQSFCAH